MTEQKDWDSVFEDLKSILMSAQTEREKREDWVDFERLAMLDRVNLLRSRRGYVPVSVEQVEVKEGLALGHIDYAQKFAIGCADLVFGNEPREIIEHVVRHWSKVAGPTKCECGHEHYGRISHSAQAPQWKFCEDVECSCRSLRPAAWA